MIYYKGRLWAELYAGDLVIFLTDAEQRVPIKIWAEAEDMRGQDGAIKQALDLAKHPTAFHHIALMPDFHQGFGMPIGGVMACESAVLPNAVGNDIGCGMLAIDTNILASWLERAELDAWRKRTYELIPCGKGRYHKEDQHHGAEPEALSLMDTPICDSMYRQAPRMLGTLGEGNHFIELQRAEDDHLWVMIHSGSRGVGAAVRAHYDKLARKLNEKWHTALPTPELAFLPTDSAEGQLYINEMRWAMKFAEANRLLMMEKTLAALQSVGVQPNRIAEVHTHHNYAQQEHHFGRNPWVHRKGAVKADGLVIIPGSMGTASYICEGLNHPDSFGSCSHGAGRVMSRTEANKTITHEQAIKMMAHVSYGVRDGAYDEMPSAYKDVDRVIENQADLVRPIHRLTPLAVVKG